MADVAKRLEKAEKYLQKGKLADALEEFLAALDEEPDNVLVRERASDVCITQGLNKKAAELLITLFDQLAANNDHAKAIATYKKLARVGSPRIEQSFRYAQLIEKGNKKEAVEIYEKSALEFISNKQKKEALAVYKRLVALDPSLENFKNEGELAASLQDGASAAAAFFQAGDLERNANRDGAKWFERAYNADPTNADAALAYAQSLVQANNGAAALKVVEPLARAADAAEAVVETYARALIALKRPADAAPLMLQLYQKNPKHVDGIAALIGSFIRVEEYSHALDLAKKTEEIESKAGRQREYVSLLKEATEKYPPDAEFLEYMVELYNASNREHDYCGTLIKLFELYYAAGNFLKAGDSLDAAAEVDPYESGHQKRLDLLKGHIDANRYRSIANRFAAAVHAGGQGAADEGPVTQSEGEPTVLEDFMLQAEIFLQYSMRSKAVERLERIQKLFPREEERNEKLRSLYMSAGFTPKYAAPAAATSGSKSAPSPAAGTSAPAATPAASPAALPKNVTGTLSVPSAVANENAVDNISRVTEITRNIYRQANVKSVLFAAVNDVGRHWNASRCVAGLCTPGKPPSAALEYCAPGIKQSEVMAIVKLIGTLQGLAVGQGAVSIPNVKSAPELEPIRQFVQSLQVESLLAVPLLDGDEHAGILILEQCGSTRLWRQTDVLVLRTIADQMVLAVNNAKLRNLMKTLAVTDEKSGLLKRASYIDVLLSEVRRGLGQNSQCSVMLLNFGRANALTKEVGEAAVESMMQQIGQICCSHIRQNDVAVRYDLTTIALVLADTNDKSAFFVVDKLRKVLGTVKVPGTDRIVPCTVGIAEAVMQTRFDPIDIVTEAINRVEAALETAKAEGGNKAHSMAPVLEAAAVA